MPSTLGFTSHSSQVTDWLRAHVVAFDERRSSPLVNLGTLGSAGDAVATGTRRLVNTGPAAVVHLPGVAENTLSVPALAVGGDLEIVFNIFVPDFTPSTTQYLLGQWRAGGTTDNDFRLDIIPDGRFVLTWTPDGGPTNRAAAFTAPGRTDNTWMWGRILLDVNNGSGQYTASFWHADDQAVEPTWGAAHATVTGSTGATSVNNGVLPFTVGAVGAFATLPSQIGVRRVIVRDSSVTELDIDTSLLTDEGATSWVTTSGQTVAINRPDGTGYKTAVLLPGCAKRLFNGTGDLLEIASHPALNFGPTDSFSAWALVRDWTTGTSGTRTLIGKRWAYATTDVGWALFTATASRTFADISDGSNARFPVSTGTYPGLSLTAVVRNVAADTIGVIPFGASSLTPVTLSDTTTGTLGNTIPVVFGAGGSKGGAFWGGELYAWGIYSGALTAAQWAALRDALLVPERAAA